jgi:hypothetical protein
MGRRRKKRAAAQFRANSADKSADSKICHAASLRRFRLVGILELLPVVFDGPLQQIKSAL